MKAQILQQVSAMKLVATHYRSPEVMHSPVLPKLLVQKVAHEEIGKRGDQHHHSKEMDTASDAHVLRHPVLAKCIQHINSTHWVQLYLSIW